MKKQNGNCVFSCQPKQESDFPASIIASAAAIAAIN